MSVALFGGSFNPPHAGHVHVAETALKRLGADQLWWMVSPGNPLKDISALPAQETRISLSKQLTNHNPRIKVTGFEKTVASKYSADLMRYLVQRYPTVSFIWVMGADNLASFHKWDRWQDIASMVPICVIDRPGSTLSTRSSRAATVLRPYRLDESDAQILKYKQAPVWSFIHAPRMHISSTQLRNEKAI